MAQLANLSGIANSNSFRYGYAGRCNSVLFDLLLDADGGRHRDCGRGVAGKLRTQYPDCFSRCLRRRTFMQNTLGIEVNEDVLPLSNMPAIVPPYFFKPNQIFAMEK